MSCLARLVHASCSRVCEHHETRCSYQAHAWVLVTTILSAVHLAQGFVCGAPYVHTDMVATIVLVAIIIVVSRRDPPSTGMPALEHAANFLAKQAWEADREQVCAHAMAPDGVFVVF
jgi:hypothetical protein